MQFSVNNKQSILNACMVRSLIEVIFISSAFLALIYFVIKYLQYEQPAPDITFQSLSSEETGYMSKKQTGLSLILLKHSVRTTNLWRDENEKEPTTNSDCEPCTVGNTNTALIASYVWGDSSIDSNTWLIQEER